MNDGQLHTLADLQAFLTGAVAMNFTVTATPAVRIHRTYRATFRLPASRR